MNMPKPFTKKKSQILYENASSETDVHKKNCLNMEELMQFEAARQRALYQLPPEERRQPLPGFVQHRIFLNQIDNFNGSHLAKYLVDIKREPDREEMEGTEELDESKMESVVDEEELGNHEEDEVRAESEELDGSGKYKSSATYEIMGTLQFSNNQDYVRPEGIMELLDNAKRPEFLARVLTCGYIVYDISAELSCHPTQVEEAKWVIETIVARLEEMERTKPKAFSKYKQCRTFILISTLMTWAKTKPIDPEDPSLPLTERDFRKRKPHPNYKIHCEMEKRVIELGKKYPNNLRTIVIGSGVTYGHEEDVLHFLFKMAWLNAPHLPIFKPGINIIPVIHVDSLASIIHNIIENFPHKYKYIIATDPHSVTLKEMTKLIAKQLGNGKTLTVDKEEAFLYPEIKQRNYDMLTSNINIAPGYIMDNLVVRWGTDAPFNENIPTLISEFKVARGLLPIKIFIHGPPASGKSFMANRLAQYYDIPHLHVKGVIDGAIQELKDKIEAKNDKNAKKEEKAKEEKIEIEGDETVDEEEEEEDEDEEEVDVETLKETLKEIEDNMDNERHRLDEEYVIRFFKEKLSSNFCKNKGFVIDGYPKTLELTKILYEPSPEEEEFEGEDSQENGQGDVSHLCNMKIMPSYVESLDASDEFLIDRVIKLPEVKASHYEEHNMCRRLTEFRAFNTEDNTPLIFYDELDVHPMIYNVEKDLDPQMEPTFQAIINHVGPPKNYGKEGKELEDFIRAQSLETNQKHGEELKAQREEIKKALEERRDNIEKWLFQKNQELEMEEKALIVMGMPLRHYLMKYIFPCLTRGLVEVARVRPDDPVDFLSEFLFRENPEGKMFQPNYEEREEKLARAIEEYETSLATRDAPIQSRSKSFTTEQSVRSGAVSGVSNLICSLASSKSAKSSKSKRSVKSKASTKSSSSGPGICTCQKSPSLSTCSSDRSPPTPVSCTCSSPSPCDSCDPCTPEDVEPCPPEVDPCKCPC